ncbi:MAG: formylglycine-generating enzyme family protein [bacterium]|nr:formylglycine-generating enzyme family protein [bacterium]
MAFIILITPLTALCQGTITGQEQKGWLLSVGSVHGVRVGMRGVFVKSRVLQGVTTNYNIGKFEVINVRESTCIVRILSLKGGWNFEPGAEALFEQRLPGLPRPRLGRVTKKLGPQKRESLADKVDTSQQGPKNSASDRLAHARERANHFLGIGDWAGAESWLRTLLEANPRDRTVRAAVTDRRHKAEAALEEEDYSAAIGLCYDTLSLVDDPAVTELRRQAVEGLVESKLRATIGETQALIEQLERVENRSPGGTSLGNSSISLIERRIATLQMLSAAHSDLEEAPDIMRALSRRMHDLFRAVAGKGMISIAGGRYLKGCTDGDNECKTDERPAHFAKIVPFLLDATEVTLAQYRAFATATGHVPPPRPDFPQGSHHPVVNVSWKNARDYCAWIGGRLPTESEWEYAARSGSSENRYPSGSHLDHESANFAGIKGRDRWQRTSPVCSFDANQWGFFDMAGNVWEWCADSYTPDYRTNQSSDGSGMYAGLKVIRGGSWLARDSLLRVSSRSWYPPSRHMFNVGFRCARSVDTSPSKEEVR